MAQKFTTEQKLVLLIYIEKNTWNPNVQEEKTYKKLIQSIKENGFTCPILVREINENTYQIIDGEHRWRACIELGYEVMKCEIIKEVDEAMAKMLTIALNNIRGQDDILKRAEILKILNEGQLSLLPWDEKELQNQLDLVKFDWEKYNKEEHIEEKKEHTIIFNFTKAQYLVVKHALELTKKEHNMALLIIVKEYLQLRTVIDKYKEVFEPEEGVNN